jgi:hypothetical protein
VNLHVMASRSFSVFVDEPLQSLFKLATTPPTSSFPNPGPSSATTTEKENLNPVTGEHANPSEVQVKKRKKIVLATKLYTPPVASKKAHVKPTVTDDAHLSPRKRSVAPAPDATLAIKKPRRGPDSERVTSRSRVRKVKGLPKLEEEPESAPQVTEHVGEVRAEGDEGERVIVQVDIDSKCYALTVSPLADVSQAFDQVCLHSPTAGDSDEAKCTVEVRSSSCATLCKSSNLCHLQKVTLKTSTTIVIATSISSKPSSDKTKSVPEKNKASDNSKGFSTPERKLIYSAFTFSSPSPTTQRLAAVRTGPSEPIRFGDFKFNFPA